MPLLAENLRTLYASLTVMALVIAALVLGRVILIPLAMATIIAFVLGPMVRRLVIWGVPESIAAIGVLLGVLSLLVGLSVVFSSQLLELAASIETYRDNIVEKARSIAVLGSEDSIIKRATSAIDNLAAALRYEMTARSSHFPPLAAETTEPRVVVETRNVYADYLASVAEPLAQMALTILFTVFLLLQHQDLRDRLIRIAGTDNLSGTISAMSDAGARLSRLFFAQAVMNMTYGVVIAVALMIIGVPNAILWGIVAAVMRFVPFIGSAIAVIPPVVLAAGVEPGWGPAIATLILFVSGELIMGQVVEPLVFGKQTGMSPFAMVVSASFWTLIWGPIGLILAAPLTILIVVLGRYVPALEIFSVLLGDEKALRPDQEFYRRVLAADSLSAVEQIEEAANATSIGAASDQIVLPALALAAQDQRLGRFEPERIEAISRTMDEITAGAFAQFDAEAGADHARKRLLVVPARGAIDVMAAEFVVSALRTTTSWSVEDTGGHSGLGAISGSSYDNRSREKSKSPLDAVLITTVGGVEPRHLELLLTRAARDFPSVKLMTLEMPSSDLSSEIEKRAQRNHRNVIRHGTFAGLVSWMSSVPGEATSEPSQTDLAATVDGRRAGTLPIAS